MINLEAGIAMGCAIFPILLVSATGVISKATEGSAGLANPGSGFYIPFLKVFMDSTKILSNEDETFRMLQRPIVLTIWKAKRKATRSLMR